MRRPLSPASSAPPASPDRDGVHRKGERGRRRKGHLSQVGIPAYAGMTRPRGCVEGRGARRPAPSHSTAPTAVPSPAAFAASSPLIGRGGIWRLRALMRRDSRLRGNDGHGGGNPEAPQRERAARPADQQDAQPVSPLTRRASGSCGSGRRGRSGRRSRRGGGSYRRSRPDRGVAALRPHFVLRRVEAVGRPVAEREAVG